MLAGVVLEQKQAYCYGHRSRQGRPNVTVATIERNVDSVLLLSITPLFSGDDCPSLFTPGTVAGRLLVRMAHCLAVQVSGRQSCGNMPESALAR